MTSYWLTVFAITTVIWSAWKLLALSYRRIYGRQAWYRNVYLRSPHWRFVRWLKLSLSGRYCSRRGAGEHMYPLQIHHAPWAYKWLYWEFLPHVLLFGLRTLCALHHRMEHER